GAAGPETDDVGEAVSALIERWSDLEADGTDPGLVVLRKKTLPGLYWQAVRSIVSRSEALAGIRGLGRWREWKSGRGIIGASAACSWRPHDRTWEILAYREASRWGTARLGDPASVRRRDRRGARTFNQSEYGSERVGSAP